MDSSTPPHPPPSSPTANNGARLVSMIGGYQGGKTCLLGSLTGGKQSTGTTTTSSTSYSADQEGDGVWDGDGASSPYGPYHGYASIKYNYHPQPPPPPQPPLSSDITDQHQHAQTLASPSNMCPSSGTDCVVVTFVDTLGHPDFLTDAACGIRVTDGALMVVDCCNGMSPEYFTPVLRQALTERVRPVVFINKVDRAILELRLDPEEAYQGFVKIIQSVNSIIDTYVDPCMKTSADAGGDTSARVSPPQGTVAIGSGLQGWAFSISHFARMYASKFGVDESKICERLWGDSFFDARNKKWLRTSINAEGEHLRRAFCQFCLDPIYQIFDAVMTENDEKIERMLKALNVVLAVDKHKQSPKELLKSFMKSFLPASETLLQMIVTHLPSPKTAQKYRAEMLYSGEPNEDDKYYMGIKNCDQSAPLIMYVSKMIPTSETGRFYAFGRIFSGTIKRGQRVRILAKDYVENGRVNKNSVFNNKRVEDTFHLHDGDQISHVHSDHGSEFSCSNGYLVGLTGIDSFIVKAATICEVEDALPPLDTYKATTNGGTKEQQDALKCPPLGPYPLKPVPVLFASHVAKVSVEVVRPSDLSKLVRALRWLSQSDSFAEVEVEHSGDHVVSVCGEAHLQSCVRFLRMCVSALGGGRLRVSEAFVSYRETITEKSSKIALSKSANRANRIYGRAQPVGEDLCEALHNGTVTPWNQDRLKCAKQLLWDESGRGDGFGWLSQDAGLIWACGPQDLPYTHQNNFLIDSVKGLLNKHEIKDSVVAGWKWSVKEGPLCEEPMRGVRTYLEDIVLTADSIHRGAGQVIPPVRRMTYGSFYLASPRLMEPFCTVTVEVHLPSSPSAETPPQSTGTSPCSTGAASLSSEYYLPSTLAKIMAILVSRGGVNIQESQPDNLSGPNMNIMKLIEYRSGVRTIVAEMPVSGAWGLQSALRRAADNSSINGGGSVGYVTVQNTVMDGWRVLPGDPTTNTSSPAHAAVLSIRERKGLRIPLPTVDSYTDTM